MFRDTKEELARLERELLAEEAPEAAEKDTPDWDDGLDALLDDPDDFGEVRPGIYQNYSNGYGSNWSHCRTYHSDRADEDPEEWSEDVQEPKQQSNTGLVITACILMLGIAGVLIFWVLRYFL